MFKKLYEREIALIHFPMLRSEFYRGERFESAYRTIQETATQKSSTSKAEQLQAAWLYNKIRLVRGRLRFSRASDQIGGTKVKKPSLIGEPVT